MAFNNVLIFIEVISAVCSLYVLVYTPVRAFEVLVLYREDNATEGEKLCKSLGYDGLAVVNTPESYAYLLRITRDMR